MSNTLYQLKEKVKNLEEYLYLLSSELKSTLPHSNIHRFEDRSLDDVATTTMVWGSDTKLKGYMTNSDLTILYSIVEKYLVRNTLYLDALTRQTKERHSSNLCLIDVPLVFEKAQYGDYIDTRKVLCTFNINGELIEVALNGEMFPRKVIMDILLSCSNLDIDFPQRTPLTQKLQTIRGFGNPPDIESLKDVLSESVYTLDESEQCITATFDKITIKVNNINTNHRDIQWKYANDKYFKDLESNELFSGLVSFSDLIRISSIIDTLEEAFSEAKLNKVIEDI